jgi:hypothetical protein
VTSPISTIAQSWAAHATTGASGVRAPASAKMALLFDKIDASSSGAISQAQFQHAFHTLSPPRDFQALGAGAIWAQLDPTKSGSVSKQDFLNGMLSQMQAMRGDHHEAVQNTLPSTTLSPTGNFADFNT